ncbi:MAG: molybdopterin-dependent oxidoreductase, partial [Candidatus Adiutrix sp.]|nr:molybdopterin-dependent oxidoreductase [Candidatus Adiutrix sp.]
MDKERASAEAKGDAAGVRVVINGASHAITGEHLEWSLLRYLREALFLTGSKCGCGQGHCGSCNVIINGDCRRSCLYKTAKLDGQEILTVEGLAPEGGRLHPVQESFIVEGVMQCGFCTPGQIMAVIGLLNKTLKPARAEIDKAFRGVLCRCGSYPRVIRAINRAATIMRGEEWGDEDRASGDMIGRSYPMIDAVGKVTGRLKYVDDYYAPGMLCGKVVWSEEPSAILKSLDKEEAEKMPGVACVLTHEDTDGFMYGPLVQDSPLLCGDRIRSRAEPLALVLAETQDQADEAAKRVKISYEVLPGLFTPQNALKEGATPITKDGNETFRLHIGKGDVDKAFSESDLVLEEEFFTQRIEHAYIEPECSITIPQPDGRYVEYSNSQAAFSARSNCARLLGLPEDKVNFVQVQVGGSFGGKGDHLCRLLSTLGAKKTGRPVRVTLSRKDSLRYHNKRHPFYMTGKLGLAKDGKIKALKVNLLGDGGAYTYFSTRVMPQAVCYSSGPYVIQNFDAAGAVAFTNNVSSGAMRGYGAPQALFMVESLIDEACRKLGLDFFEVRRLNGLRPGSECADGQVIGEGHAFIATLDAVEKRMKEELLPMKEKDPTIGLGVASGWRHTSGGLGPDEDSNADIDLLDDGALLLRICVAEMGNESQVAMAQMAAKTMDVPYECVKLGPQETDKLSWGGSVMSSRGTFLWGHSAIGAAKKMTAAILDFIAQYLVCPMEELEFKGGVVYRHGEKLYTLPEAAALAKSKGVFLTAHHYSKLPQTRWPREDCNSAGAVPKKDYIIHNANSYVTLAVAVKADPETGRARVLKMIEALDAGVIINPEAARRQVEGGMLMMMGMALDEEFVVAEGVSRT